MKSKNSLYAYGRKFVSLLRCSEDDFLLVEGGRYVCVCVKVEGSQLSKIDKSNQKTTNGGIEIYRTNETMKN